VAGRLAPLSLGHAAAIVAAAMLLYPGAGLAQTQRRAAPTAEAVVQFDAGVRVAERRAAVRAAGGRVIRDLRLIRGLGVRLAPEAAERLARMPGVHAVTPNARMRAAAAAVGNRWSAWSPTALRTAFPQATRADKAWTDPNRPTTGAGVAVAVIDSGIAGDLPDFRNPETGASRVIATVVTNPDATAATDRYGHGTHVAGLVAGNGRALDPRDPLFGAYIGTAPSARLVSIKASDDHGNATIIDVIAGLQFVVDRAAAYGIRVVNLSLGSSLALPYGIDPLDAAVEATWLHGIVVVVAAGNEGLAAGAVSYAPANDPFAITVGAVDDRGTKATDDDRLAPWSSRGVTQDGFSKPEIVAPGAHIAAPLAPGSDYASLCPGCIVDGRYFSVGGTSMAAPIVAGIAADLISAHPTWTPNQVKGALVANVRLTRDGASEVAADLALYASKASLVANVGVRPGGLIDPSTGDVDGTRAWWGRASWKLAADPLRAIWAAVSWTCDCFSGDATVMTRDLRASWKRASWKSFLGDTPRQYGELEGGASGRVAPGSKP
jgi:serine protease AprX